MVNNSKIEDICKKIDSLKEKQAKKEAEKDEKKKQVTELENQVTKLENQVTKLENQMAELQEERERLEENEKILTSNYDKTKKELEEIRKRANLDMETAQLLETGPRLRKGTISGAIEALLGDLEAVENRVAQVLQIQKQFNDVVRKTVRSGDGKLTTEAEYGGAIHDDSE